MHSARAPISNKQDLQLRGCQLSPNEISWQSSEGRHFQHSPCRRNPAKFPAFLPAISKLPELSSTRRPKSLIILSSPDENLPQRTTSHSAQPNCSLSNSFHFFPVPTLTLGVPNSKPCSLLSVSSLYTYSRTVP